MSAEALNYVEKLRKAPSGVHVSAREKAVLQVMANAHCDKRRASWLNVNTIAEILHLHPRTIRDRLKSCIAKGILWYDQRFEAGRQLSHLWRFAEIDGAETEEARQARLRLEARGREGRLKAASRISEFSTVSTGGVLRESAVGYCGNPQWGTAGIRSGVLREPADQDPILDPVQNPIQEPVPVVTAAVENAENSDFKTELEKLQRKLEDRRRQAGLDRRGPQRVDRIVLAPEIRAAVANSHKSTGG